MLFWCARTSTTGAYQMQAVAVGWQLYDLTNDPLDLGLVGLVQFIPVVTFAIAIGQIADRFDRRTIAGTCQVIKAICAAALALGTWQGLAQPRRHPGDHVRERHGAGVRSADHAFDRARPGAAAAVAARHRSVRDRAADRRHLRTGAGRFSLPARPGDRLRALHRRFRGGLHIDQLRQGRHRAEHKKPLSVQSLFAGFGYIWRNPILLGAISLDLFAVLFGGVTALLPIFARDILGTGPWGLGLLRSAPAVGALSMSVFLAHNAIERNAGRIMFVACRRGGRF